MMIFNIVSFYSSGYSASMAHTWYISMRAMVNRQQCWLFEVYNEATNHIAYKPMAGHAPKLSFVEPQCAFRWPIHGCSARHLPWQQARASGVAYADQGGGSMGPEVSKCSQSLMSSSFSHNKSNSIAQATCANCSWRHGPAVASMQHQTQPLEHITA